MKKLLKNQKGLTLVELLAVIVILGIIAAIAVPAIANIIDNSRKDAHVANAEALYDAARLAMIGEDISGEAYFYANGDDPDPDTDRDGIDLVDLDYLDTELDDPSGGNSEGEYDDAYVHYDGDDYLIHISTNDNDYFEGQEISFIRSTGRAGFGDDLIFETE